MKHHKDEENSDDKPPITPGSLKEGKLVQECNSPDCAAIRYSITGWK
jgi:hypothetical protein